MLTVFLNGCKSGENTVFTAVPSAQSGISFHNKPLKKEYFNILYYLYYYNGGGVATGDINNDGLQDIYFTANNKGGNKLYLNKGNMKFEDITDKAGVKGNADWCSGVSMADVNSDGYLDIYVSTVSGRYGLKGHNELYINNKNNSFTESSEKYGLNTSCATTQSAFFDYDRDGDLDCYILNQSHHPHANIIDTSNRRKYDTLSGDRLYRNDISTSGKFTEVSKEAGIYQSNLGYGLGLALADINNDGWDDIYVGNDFHENDYYYINNANGTFTESGAKHFRHYSRFSMGNDVADYNNDGHPDIVTVDMLPPDEKVLKTYGSDENPDVYKVKLDIQGYQKQYSKNCLQRNNGNGISFSETSLINGVSATDWSWSPLFADFDNDGYKDLFISSGIVKRPVDLDYIRFISDLKMKGLDNSSKYDDEAINAMPDGASHPFLFRGNGSGPFTDVSKGWGTGKMKGYFTGAAYADLDNDGNLDLVMNCINAEAVVLKNNSAPKKTITVTLTGNDANKFGLGAKVWVFSGNRMQYQQLAPARGFQSSSDYRLHFGIDSANIADSMLVVWPDQKYQLIKNVVAGKITANQDAANGVFDYHAYFKPRENYFEPTAISGLNWAHHENDFLDYNAQYLIPHLESTRGPKIAAGDVNKDGLTDIYLCGAKFQPGALMIQQKDGSFASVDTALFSKYAVCEDVDALFFDANGDGHQDLWVVSGGNEMPANEIASADRLFINDGTGHFTASQKSIPRLFENKSCVTAADIDKDGDNDVFVGFLSDPMRYGIPQNSYLYLNDGQGNFSSAGSKIMNLLNLGMVTAAGFSDLNKDSWPDLVVTGEFMPVKIFMNNKGIFSAADIAASTGLWQSISMADINGDGFTDIFAGNWGFNNKFHAGKNGPVKCYVKDFDGNGSIEQILAYTIDGKEYPFLAKDELERPLPVLKKAYLKYDEVAGKTVDYIFYDLFKDYTELKAEELASCYFLNDGKGNFKKYQLPPEAQLAPVFSFAPLPTTTGQFIIAGNFYGVIPYEGRYDALLPTIFSYNNQHKDFTQLANLPAIEGEIRDIKWINQPNREKLMLIARNNAPLIFLKPKK
ncbi:MAG: VCBS repeat-containing protein [Ferruginibacter sp.]